MNKKKCSLKVKKDGRMLHGTAALLHVTSKNGGFDAWAEEFAESVAKDAAKTAVTKLLKEQQKPDLKVL